MLDHVFHSNIIAYFQQNRYVRLGIYTDLFTLNCVFKYSKLRYNNHIMSFRHKKRVKYTELSKYLWKLKDENADYNLQWTIKAYASPYKCGRRKRDLCITEKMIIARSDPKKLLKKRTKLVYKCRHRNKFLLSNIK